MPLLDPANLVTSVTSTAVALMISQDRHGATTLRLMLTDQGQTDPAYFTAAAAVTDLDTPAPITDPAVARLVFGAIAAAEGVTVAPADLDAGLRAAGIYERAPEPVAPARRRT